MNTSIFFCKYCGKPLTLTPEYDTCMECQGRIMRESTIPQGAFATNSTQQMITHEEIIKDLESFYHLYGSNEVLRKFRKYALQQQAKEERAKKVEELLGLYRSVYGVVQAWDTMPDVHKQIKSLEEEMK